jgi:glycosyltransferase involved in cell wall biosynthesis
MKKYKETYETYMKILNENARPEQKQCIIDLLSNFYPTYYNPSGKPIAVIFGGYFYDRYWNGKMFYENEISLGGSESMAIKLAHLLSSSYNVYVFLNTEQDVDYKGVHYVKVEKYQQFMEINKVKHLILSRDSTRTHPNAEKTHLWLHDLVNVGELKSPKEYTSIIVLSKFHKSYYEEVLAKTHPNNYKEYSSRIRIIPNIVDVSESPSKKKNSTHRFIYSSCPTRGLVKVLEDFPRIKDEFPEAELYLYCDFNNDYVRNRLNVNETLMKIALMKGVYNVGRLPEKLFLEEVKKCNFWYYPTDFLETFCITAVQMMNNGVIPIYNPVGALPDVIQNSGIRVDKSKNEDIVAILKNLKEKDVRRHIDSSYEQSKKYSEKNVKKQWTNLL